MMSECETEVDERFEAFLALYVRPAFHALMDESDRLNEYCLAEWMAEGLELPQNPGVV